MSHVPDGVTLGAMDDPSRYARPELERRWLLDGVPEGAVLKAHLVDRYLDGTRLRLRVVHRADGTVVRKLGHKVRVDPGDPAEVWHTSLYLDDEEHEVLANLPGPSLTKDRYDGPGAGCSVDVFTGELSGLVLAEVECHDRTAFDAVVPPPGAVAEVTHDDRFSGGQLARTSADALAGMLRGGPGTGAW